MIQPKDVIVLPVSGRVQGLVQSALVRLLPATFEAMEREEAGRLEDRAEDSFAMVVTCIVAQAEALNRLVDLLVEPGSVPMVLVGVKVREAVRARVQGVFRAGGEA